jgi:Xaa-Pro aminopeptidase
MHHSLEKLALIRSSMKEAGLDAYIISDTDPHIEEYVPEHWRTIEWISGFTGSSATLIITQCFAGLWTDSRYLIQAEEQLTGSGILLMSAGQDEKNNYAGWLSANLEQGSNLGLDGRTFSINRMKKISGACFVKNIITVTDCDLITSIWPDRPPITGSPVTDHSVEFSGKERSVKIQEVREEMKRMNIGYHLLASPDDIMWLLNIRGNDLNYSPLLLSFAIIGMEQILLFADEDKIPYRIAQEFDRLNIILLPYEEVYGIISTLRSESGILISPMTTSTALYNSIHPGLIIKEDISIPARLKQVKNSIEISNLRNAMIKDGVALTRFFYWIESNSGSVPMTELSLCEKLYHFRSMQENFISLSFSSIVAYNEHAALPHYKPEKSTDSVIRDKGILLVDSGSQYPDGTTDITRTIAIGTPSERQKTDFTLVLKGMINLSMAHFPFRTFGHQLDILAREALWNEGLNYGHSTGHGVGYCLNVHEGPVRISPVEENDPQNYLKPGNLISDEPAIYRKGEYGIRIENLILCIEDEDTGYGQFLKFDNLSLCYIDTKLIETSLLGQKEIDWLNNYHAMVFSKLGPFLTGKEKNWLKEKTRPL